MKKKRRPAMRWRDLPAFVEARLRGIEAGEGAGEVLPFAILTGVRSARCAARWDEFNLDAGTWTVLGGRMKAQEPHRVPLSLPALVKWLKEQRRHESQVFSSPRGKVLSDMTLTVLLRRVKARKDTPGRVATAHGFRSSFRDWVSEHGYALDLCERALAHTVVVDQVEAACHRTDLLEHRAAL
ncbi:tyrosine-type recombinase/integrase [Paraburkholderia caballeronis]|uniref:tyrosine-type recombinase/integrase n=1 Tax=Paraburkholderia caballeronis TaxID=416943 RepID=UPI001FBA30DA|nr:tyrosine-type recombinase/integrase [Paraburkholderia caballeronis]